MKAKKNKSTWIRRSAAASIGFVLGCKYDKYMYPVSNLIVESCIDKDLVCRIARHLNLKVHHHKREWQERGINIDEIIKSKNYKLLRNGQEKENQV